MTSILQISDPHFGTELPHVAKALIRLAQALAPDVLIVSGDITQRAQLSQFKAARAFFDKLGIARQLVIPGNHDIALFNIAQRALYPYAGFKRAFGQQLEPVFASEELLIVTLNTTRRYRHVDGEVSLRQIERVERLLISAKPSQLRIVVTHQPVSVMQSEDEADLLHRHVEAIRRWTEAGVDLILGGHIHLPYVCALQEQYPQLSRSSWAIQAGTCMSSRLRHEAGNSVNLIRYGGLSEPVPKSSREDGFLAMRSCTLERWDYQDSSNSFERVSTHSLTSNALAHVEPA